MAKYKNYTQLAAAFKSGKLDKKKYFMMLDKSGTECSLSAHYDGKLSEEENEKLQEVCSDLFSPSGGDLPIEQALKCLGIPSEWC